MKNCNPKAQRAIGRENTTRKIFLGLLFLLLWGSSLHAHAPFSQGKTISLVDCQYLAINKEIS